MISDILTFSAGEIHSSEYAPSFTDMEDMNPETAAGGWTPKFCFPRHRVAVIIPYANRLQHLKVFLKVMHPLLQRQLLHYQIFVIEQVKSFGACITAYAPVMIKLFRLLMISINKIITYVLKLLSCTR